MSLRSLGAKLLNNTKILANTHTSISKHVNPPTDSNETNEHKQTAQTAENKNEYHNTKPWLKRSNHRRRKKRQKMHFKPIIPEHYICPITQELMTDPVIISSGHTFERSAILEWLQNGNSINPLTGQQLQNVDIKPNYALKEAIIEYRRKLADELFRITFDETTNKEMLYYRDNVLFSKEISEENDDNDDRNEFDGYISDDEEDIDDNSDTKCNKKRKRRKHSTRRNPNIPIIAFLGPNSTGKSTLLNLIVGEPVFVTIDELSDYDTLSKVVRFKIVTRADREFILLDVEGLFPSNGDTVIDDAVLKIFFAVYSISSVIVWNDTDEDNVLLKELLHRVDGMMRDLNRDGNHLCGPHIIDDDFMSTPSGALLPQELREFLLKKHKKLCKKGRNGTHKPAFIILRRDYVDEQNEDSDCIYTDDTDDTDYASPSISPRLQSVSSSTHYTMNVGLTTCTSESEQILSIVDENKEEVKYDVTMSDSSVNNVNLKTKSRNYNRKSSTMLFSEYIEKDNAFAWLRSLDLFCFIDGVMLAKLDNINNDSLLSVLPRVENWINCWCRLIETHDIQPIVRNNKSMLSVIGMINKYNTLSSVKYVQQCIQIKGSRLYRYFYYDSSVPRLNELKLIAERFEWDNTNIIRWFIKHFNRLWYFIRDFPNAHEALLYQALFCEYYNDNKDCGNSDRIVPIIILNLSHFYYQISHKVDLYRNIVVKSAEIGEFAGAVGGLSSLSLMSVLHPLVGIAAVPFSIHLASIYGGKSGAKVGDMVANSKAHLIDGTERYDLGKIKDDDAYEDEDKDQDIVYRSCYDSE